MPHTPLPRRPAPPLSVDLVDGGTWDLHAQEPEHFTLVVFYRGLHCPICKKYLSTLNRLRDRFAERGTEVVAVSMDPEARARTAAQDWDVDALPLGYGLTETQARDWGLYLSDGVKDGEPDRFSEPGLFLVRPDGTLYLAVVNSVPFARPPFDDLLKAIDFVLENDYPARGEVAEAALVG
ncbi:MAG: peroxiredoxin-like family protein [Rhodothermales bacterium]|nr:peroxiredoxin-like family protein [Rhodothermales bacterium]